MDLAVLYRPNPLLSSSSTSLLRPSQDLGRLRRPRISRKGPIFRASASTNPNGSGGSEQFWSELGETLKKGTEFDPGGAELTRFSSESVGWSHWLCWKDLKNWDPKRFGALVVYTLLVMISFSGVYVAVRASLIDRQRKGLTEACMEALVPDPSPDNVRRFKNGIWRASTPEGLKSKKEKSGISVKGSRGTWRERWWRYRPKFPYSYFLQKLDSSEVAAVVFSEDLKRLYITMKEGFPLEYIVDVPSDPYLFDGIASSGVEVDFLQKRQIHYFMKAVIPLVPGILLLFLIHRMHNRFSDMAYAENLIMPVGSVCETKSMSEEVVLGGDVWDLLDELMLYMRNPGKYYDQEVPFVRGVLLSGPPGTGKTHFARTLSKNSGLPFVHASGVEFTSGADGATKIIELFHTARRHAPSFVFIDDIDAIAGRHNRSSIKIKSVFTALLNQLDGEKVKAGAGCFSVKQAVIFICATNMPEELDPVFVRAIDRHVKIGPPNEKQRVQIFSLHGAGTELAEGVDFRKLVFRTIGYSGADIRNLVNEAAIMSVRKVRSKIHQEDIVDVLDKQLLEGMGALLTEDEQQKVIASAPLEKKRLLAVHEAGHIVLAHLFPRFDQHAFSQLLPGGQETAISVFYPCEDMLDLPHTPFGYMEMQMVVTHGGRCAERIVFGDITDGGTHDLIKITSIARELVILHSPLCQRGDHGVVPSNMMPEVSELFTRELTRYIEETEELAMNGLRDNMLILDMIAAELLENSKITGSEVIEKLKGMSPIMFDGFVEMSFRFFYQQKDDTIKENEREIDSQDRKRKLKRGENRITIQEWDKKKRRSSFYIRLQRS